MRCALWLQETKNHWKNWKNVKMFPDFHLKSVFLKKCVDLHSKYEGKSIQIYANHHHHRNFRKHFTFLKFSQLRFSKFFDVLERGEALFEFELHIYLWNISLSTSSVAVRFSPLLGLDLLTIQKLSWEIYWDSKITTYSIEVSRLFARNPQV